jgi:hypothetical protein
LLLWGVLLVVVGVAVEALSATGTAGKVAGYGVVVAFFATLVWWQLWRYDRRRRAQSGG